MFFHSLSSLRECSQPCLCRYHPIAQLTPLLLRCHRWCSPRIIDLFAFWACSSCIVRSQQQWYGYSYEKSWWSYHARWRCRYFTSSYDGCVCWLPLCGLLNQCSSAELLLDGVGRCFCWACVRGIGWDWWITIIGQPTRHEGLSWKTGLQFWSSTSECCHDLTWGPWLNNRLISVSSGVMLGKVSTGVEECPNQDKLWSTSNLKYCRRRSGHYSKGQILLRRYGI